jgi:hypothetical protein
MGEIARPMDLALHGWGREFEEMAAAARERKFQREKELERGKKMGGRACNHTQPPLKRGKGGLAEMQVVATLMMTTMETRKKLWTQRSLIPTVKKAIRIGSLG